MRDTCGCCEGTEISVPVNIWNRPGLNVLRYRIGIHGSFLESMKARLSSSQYPMLQNLKTREGDDASIALLDSWATVADVLTFYQERIANEGFLRTATERRSILEMASLIGYRLRPGVAASVYLAFTIENGFDVEIPKGTRAQSLPGPGELPQPFETSEPLKARSAWNTLRQRLTQPQFFTSDMIDDETPLIYLDGTTTNLKPNSPLLVTFNTRLLFSVDDQDSSQENDQDNKKSDNLDNQVLSESLMSEFTANGYDLTAPVVVIESIGNEWMIIDGVKQYSIIRIEIPEKSQIKSVLNIYSASDEVKINQVHLLYRTLDSEINQEAKRTKITIFPWQSPFLPTDADSQDFTMNLKDVLIAIINHYEELKEFGLSTNKTAKKVLPILTDEINNSGLKEKIAPPSNNEEVPKILDDAQVLKILGEAIAQLQEIFDTIDIQARRLRDWLEALVAELTLVQSTQPIIIQAYTDATKEPDDQQILAILDEPIKQLNIVRGTPEAQTQYLQGWLENTISQLELAWTAQHILIQAYADVAVATDDQKKVDFLNKAIEQLTRIQNSQDTQTQYLLKWLDGLIAKLEQAKPKTAVSTFKSILAVRSGALSGPFVDNLAINLVKFGQINFFPLPPIISIPSPVLPSSSVLLARDKDKIYARGSDVINRMLVKMDIVNRSQTNVVWGNVTVPEAMPKGDTKILNSVEALRVISGLFGHTGPQFPNYDDKNKLTGFKEQTLKNTWNDYFKSQDGEGLKVILLDQEYNQIKSGSWIAIEQPNSKITPPSNREDTKTITIDASTTVIAVNQVTRVQNVSVAVNGAVMSVTLVFLRYEWLTAEQVSVLNDSNNKVMKASAFFLRNVRVYAQPEPLILAEIPISDPIEGNIIEMAELYDGLESGRWLILSGERADIRDDFGNVISGIMASEQVMLDQVIQDVQHIDEETDLPGDHPHSFLKITPGLVYKYKRDTVTIYANVVKATHGETLTETFGSGDGGQAFQQFILKQIPLTHTAAPTSEGAESTLVVRVNDVEWHETNSFAGLGYKDRNYVLRMDDDGKTSMLFGDGKRGARLPTGVENIKGKYRRGIGKVGNVKAEQVKLLATKPLHVKGVVNPNSASGGADHDTRDQARRNAPLTVAALDRLVSVQDYEDFARVFAGIGKAIAVKLSDGRREVVHLTIAGVDDIPIDQSSDLYRNLRRALQQFGEPYRPIVVDLRELSLLIISANVQLSADYDWELVEPKIRAAMLDVFGFEQRELGQAATYSEVVSTIQAVEGVAYVDLDTLDAVDDRRLKNFLERNGEEVQQNDQSNLNERLQLTWNPRVSPKLAYLDPQTNQIVPAQMAYLDPTLPDTLILTELPS